MAPQALPPEMREQLNLAPGASGVLVATGDAGQQR